MICPRCGTQNPAGTNFCAKCGENLAGPLAQGQTAPQQQQVKVKKKRGLMARGCGCLAVIVVLAIVAAVALSLSGKIGGTGGGGGLGDSTFTIKVGGTAGTAFSGTYDVTHIDGSSTQKSVDGKVPATYTVSGNIISVGFQKQSGGSETLRVDILKGSDLVKSSDTQAAYGMVSVATQ